MNVEKYAVQRTVSETDDSKNKIWDVFCKLFPKTKYSFVVFYIFFMFFFLHKWPIWKITAYKYIIICALLSNNHVTFKTKWQFPVTLLTVSKQS